MEEAGQTLGTETSEAGSFPTAGQASRLGKRVQRMGKKAGGQRGAKDGGRVLLPRRGDEREEKEAARRFSSQPGCLTVSAENF